MKLFWNKLSRLLQCVTFLVIFGTEDSEKVNRAMLLFPTYKYRTLSHVLCFH